MTQKRQAVRQSTSQARVHAAPAVRAPLARSEAGASRPLATRETSVRASSIVPSRREDEGGDSILTRYFREMATHQVMGAEEELEAAERVEKTEVDLWKQILAYLPAAPHLLSVLETQVAEMAEEDRPALAALPELKTLVAAYGRQGSFKPDQLESWTELTLRLAREIRMPDSDRIWMNTAMRTAQRFTQEVGIDEEDRGVRRLGRSASQRHRLRSGGALVEQRRAGDGQTGEVLDDGLEVE